MPRMRLNHHSLALPGLWNLCAWEFFSTLILSRFQPLPCRPPLWVPCRCHVIGSQNFRFPTLFRVAPTQPGHGGHAPARRFLSMLFLPLVPQTKKNQDLHFGLRYWKSLGLCGRCCLEDSLFPTLVCSGPTQFILQARLVVWS